MIVNGDDFGLSEAANRGVVEAFARGLISSATLMANQPGFDEAVDLAHERGLTQCVGVHLVLTQGVPLTEAIRRRTQFCDEEGRFKMWAAGPRPWLLSTLDREALVEELRAQVARVRSARIPVTHVDSHHQAHTHWQIGSAVIALSGQLGIPFVRLARNSGPGINVARKVYKNRFNARLRRHALARTRYFGVASDWEYMRSRGVGQEQLDDFELMTHPQIDGEGDLVDAITGTRLADHLGSIPHVSTATSFSGARP